MGRKQQKEAIPGFSHLPRVNLESVSSYGTASITKFPFNLAVFKIS